MAKTVLYWDKPKKVMTKEEWAGNQADGAPPGTFTPNMSDEDRAKWKAKLVGQKTGFPQVEIRKDSTVIIVSLNGYKYRHYDTRRTPENLAKARRFDRDASFADWPVVHFASAGPMQLTYQELDELQSAIQEALGVLYTLPKEQG